MLFSYNWLQEFIKTKLPAPEKLADLLALHVFEVESIEKKGADVLLDISILPQRGDCLSHLGIAREISAILEQELIQPEIAPIKTQKGTLQPLKVFISVPRLVPRYSAVVVEGVTIGASPQWMQERLEALGVNSINNVVDITNFVMLELGQPLHAFDYQKIQGQKITIRESKAGERISLLDNTELLLQKGMLIAEDSKRLIDLAGIKGGKVSGIEKNTKNIVLQAAVFDRQKIYQTKKALGYSSFAADIYSHEIDFELCSKALERALFLLAKFGGGKQVQFIDMYPAKKKPITVPFVASRVEELLGIAIPQEKIKKILKNLGFGNKIPSWRKDVLLPEDLVEEVGRIYGYENIQPKFPEAALMPPEKNISLSWQEQARNTMKEAGFTEVYNYSFVTKGENNATRLVELENPISEEFEYMRASLLPNLMKNIESNQKIFAQKDMRIFEIGKVFEKAPHGEIREHNALGAIFSPVLKKKKDAFYEMKGVLDLLLSRLGITEIWYTKDDQSQKSAKIIISQDKEIGMLCEISSHTLEARKISRQVIALEIDFDLVVQNALEEREYVPPSKYPAALRDIALLVPFEVKVEDVLNAMERAGGELVADIDLFDMYEGEELPSGKKNLAFHIVYQAADRTLKNEEVDALQTKIIKVLEENENWEVRS